MYVCVCSQVVHLAVQSFVCLAMMHVLRPGVMEKAVFVWAMGYLCFGHIYRLYYDYGGYTLDITGSVDCCVMMMMAYQSVSQFISCTVMFRMHRCDLSN